MKQLFYFLMAIGLIVSFQACSSDSDTADSNSDGTSNTDDNETHLVLKTIHQTGPSGYESQFNFNCDGNKLVSFIYGTDSYYEYTYEDDLISQYQSNDGSIEQYEYDSESRLIRSYYSNAPNVYYKEKLVSYDGSLVTVEELLEIPGEEIVQHRLLNMGFNDGNLTDLTIFEYENTYQYEITYDNNPNALSGIIGLDKFGVLRSECFGFNCSGLFIGANNPTIIECIGVNGTNFYSKVEFTYEYNSKGYPITITTDNGFNYTLEYY